MLSFQCYITSKNQLLLAIKIELLRSGGSEEYLNLDLVYLSLRINESEKN